MFSHFQPCEDKTTTPPSMSHEAAPPTIPLVNLGRPLLLFAFSLEPTTCLVTMPPHWSLLPFLSLVAALLNIVVHFFWSPRFCLWLPLQPALAISLWSEQTSFDVTCHSGTQLSPITAHSFATAGSAKKWSNSRVRWTTKSLGGK